MRRFAQKVDDATATPIYISYRLADEWFDGIHGVLEDLADQIPNRPVVVLRLLEHFARRLDRASGGMDDADGSIVEAGSRLRDLLVACAEAVGLSPAETSELITKLASLELWPDA